MRLCTPPGRPPNNTPGHDGGGRRWERGEGVSEGSGEGCEERVTREGEIRDDMGSLRGRGRE